MQTNGHHEYKLKNILLIEGDGVIRQAVRCALATLGHTVIAIETAEEGLQAVALADFECVICNYHLSGMNGLEFFSIAHKDLAPATKVLTAASGDDYLVNNAYAQGVHVFMEKPFTMDNLLTCIQGLYLESQSAADSYRTYVTNEGKAIQIVRPDLYPSPEKRRLYPGLQPVEKSVTRPGRHWKLYLNHNKLESCRHTAPPHLELVFSKA